MSDVPKPRFRFVRWGLAAAITAIALAYPIISARFIVPTTAVKLGFEDSPTQIFGPEAVQAMPDLIAAAAIVIVVLMFAPDAIYLVRSAVSKQPKQED
ncbi:MAG: hypothetical protein HY876_04115 [Coriobacteriales bacterium]|nr:hypothetical protein [Coriobacteriales bacterium]